MGILPFFTQKNEFFTTEEKQQIINGLREVEKQTSGEVRVYIESRCRFMDAIDRASEIFFQLKMDMTEKRNAVLIYLAMHDQQLAVFGDDGIHKAVGKEFWETEMQKMIAHFRHHDFVNGICEIINDIGKALQKHFPYDGSTDKNELPDDIIFGK